MTDFINNFIAALPTQLSYFYRNGDSGRPVAHCLEFNLITSGADRADAEKRLDLLVKKYILYAFLNADVDAIAVVQAKAPQHYWDSFYGNDPRREGYLWVDLPKNEGAALPRSAADFKPKASGDEKCIPSLPLISIPKMQPHCLLVAA